jgi:predicted nucleic acid-binding Zn finger protein
MGCACWKNHLSEYEGDTNIESMKGYAFREAPGKTRVYEVITPEHDTYTVDLHDTYPRCDCPAFQRRGTRDCKHIRYVQRVLGLEPEPGEKPVRRPRTAEEIEHEIATLF